MARPPAIAAAFAPTAPVPWVPRRRGRRGMNLVEVMVAVGIMVVLIALALPAAWYMFGVQQRTAAQELGVTLGLLHDEAQMQNVTFRVAYHLDEGYYQVELGDARTLIFDDPALRQAHEEAVAEKLARKPKTAREEAEGPELDEYGVALEPGRFAALQDQFLKRFDLPSGTVFGGVYTAQYEGFVRPSDPEEIDPENPVIAYSYLFPNGFAEHVVVHLVSASNPESGFTVEMEPMSGRVHIDRGLRDWDELLRELPDRGPELE